VCHHQLFYKLELASELWFDLEQNTSEVSLQDNDFSTQVSNLNASFGFDGRFRRVVRFAIRGGDHQEWSL
jgi:hypothetical protein